MPRGDVTTSWRTCDGCARVQAVEAKSSGLPAGWTNTTTTIDVGSGPHGKTLDLCPECSKDLAAVVRRYKARLGQ
jgi:hypothetical protein